jgi:hypothetical protein
MGPPVGRQVPLIRFVPLIRLIPLTCPAGVISAARRIRTKNRP